MKSIIVLAILALLSGCANMTPREKQTAYIVGAVVVAAVIISANEGSKPQEQECFIYINSGGQSSNVCR